MLALQAPAALCGASTPSLRRGARVLPGGQPHQRRLVHSRLVRPAPGTDHPGQAARHGRRTVLLLGAGQRRQGADYVLGWERQRPAHRVLQHSHWRALHPRQQPRLPPLQSGAGLYPCRLPAAVCIGMQVSVATLPACWHGTAATCRHVLPSVVVADRKCLSMATCPFLAVAEHSRVLRQPHS